MWRRILLGRIVEGILVAGGVVALAQPPGAPQAQPVAPVSVPAAGELDAQSIPEVHGGRLHGMVKSGNIPLPGVTVTAQNTLSGKRFQTTTDITGAWSLTIPQNGRYVIRTQFAAFAPSAEEAVLNAVSHDQTVDFALVLASRAAQRESESASTQISQSAIRQLAASGAQNLGLMSVMGADTESQPGQAGAAEAALPSIAGN
ncbi:MAG: carboxypeptidase-like regulatory domain-containing protein, partial [Terracidiphilus sp.]